VRLVITEWFDARLSPFMPGFWVKLNTCPVPRTLVREVGGLPDCQILTIEETRENVLDGPEDVLREWLPEDVFR